MKKRAQVTIIIILALVQVTILDYFKVFNVKPDLLLICTIAGALFFEFKPAILLALLAGALKDVFSVDTSIRDMLLFAFWVYLIKELGKRVPLENTSVRVFLVIAALIFSALINRGISLYALNPIPLGVFLRSIFLESLYTGLVSLMFFKLIR